MLAYNRKLINPIYRSDSSPPTLTIQLAHRPNTPQDKERKVCGYMLISTIMHASLYESVRDLAK